MKPANILSDTGYKASIRNDGERQLMRTIVFDRDISDGEREAFLEELSNFDEIAELCSYFRTTRLATRSHLTFGYYC